ncbi:hypothetical protein [Haloarcula japonica]|uniref:hypothetical protein n=1 Tax=Haloarcula japonica TaxID=29282 RepID=UPI001267E523|nr:hypothetical protein [Haloarcula japonica]
MPQTRRSYLASIVGGSVILSGCSSNQTDSSSGGSGDDEDYSNQNTERPDADGDGVPDSEDDYPNDASLSVREEVLSERQNVLEDEWLTWELPVETETYFEYDMIVRSGPSVDLYTVTESEYSYFESGDNFEYITGLSSPETTGDRGDTWLESGNYVLVVDNSEYGNATPPTNLDEDPAEVELTVTASL